METQCIFDKVKCVLIKTLKNMGTHQVDIQLESSLIADLGFTSIMFMDLTIDLEDAFQISEFPIQDWIDEQTLLGELGFRVQSLVNMCKQLIEGH